MSVVYVALPASIALAALGLVAFVWAVRSGQMDDVETPAKRMLLDDDVEPGD
jgi:cbb3-type cytochrome oxidase maturation protein